MLRGEEATGGGVADLPSGNVVQFCPTHETCFVQNIASSKRLGLRKKGGVYVIGVKFVYGGKVVWTAEITIDSGAEESVRPKSSTRRTSDGNGSSIVALEPAAPPGSV